MPGRFAEIIINITHENVDRPFTYIVPDEIRENVDIGSRVIIPFGKGNRETKGVIVGFKNESEFPEEKIKKIIRISDKDVSMSDYYVTLASWMRSHYGGTMIQALKTVLPVKQKVQPKVKKYVVLNISKEKLKEEISDALMHRNAARLRLMYALLDEECIPKSLVDEKLHISQSTINKMVEMGIIKITEERIARKALNVDYKRDSKFALNDDQQKAVDEITSDFCANTPGKYLIYGITGSGKTEVYMQIIENVLKKGRQAIVLIPEIALTYQTVMRFYKRFGDCISIMNSTLSPGEKYEQFVRCASGEIKIIIGPRSALFVPFPNLGVIIIDEEHEGTYKSENIPKYHARETAEQIAKINNAALVLGSATPSVDAFYRAEIGEYKLFTLNKRASGSNLATVSVADLREELKAGNRSIISRHLSELMEDRLAKGQQIMLFLNRRGFAGFVSCRNCGFVVKCPHCDVSLTLHKNGKMVCHYCGYTSDKFTNCPECGSKYILGFSAGTEQVEEAVHKMFPTARTLRMDADTTKEKESYEKILSAFLDRQADILIGTQMIVKGHDFKNVTLVGVLAADLSLFASDFRAPEKTFQLLTQAAGRAGRGDLPGEVVIQTYQPEHYCIQYAARQDYLGFYDTEMGFRETMDYPPAAHMLCILVTSRKEEAAKRLSENLAKGVSEMNSGTVIGPAPASISKINDVYRFVLYIKNNDYEQLVRIKDEIEERMKTVKTHNESVQFDFDPQSIL